MNGKDINVKELIKQDPERYVIIEESNIDLQAGQLIEGHNGQTEQVIVAHYPRDGCYVIDTQPTVASTESVSKLEDLMTVKEATVAADYQMADSEIGYIDILTEQLGQMTIRRLQSRSEAMFFTVVSFEELPIVFTGTSLEKCFEKLIRFMLTDVLSLIHIFENKTLRQNLKKNIEGVMG